MSQFASGSNQGLSFIVKNNASTTRVINIFGIPLVNGQSIDLMKVPGFGEDDIRTSVLKGELGRKMVAGVLQLVSSTLNFESADPAYTSLLVSLGLSAATTSAGGGAGSVANIAALSLINDASEIDGAKREVATVLQSFKLDKSSTATVDNITVAATKSGTGRWLRQITSVPTWTNQRVWKVSNATGNDENSGAVGFPLKSLAEVCRRITRWKMVEALSSPVLGTFPTYYDIQALDDIPSTDSWRPTGEVDTGDVTSNQVYSWLLRGVRTTYLAASVTSAAASVPATNTPPMFNGGASFLPGTDTTLIGKMIVVPNGIGNGLDVVSWIQRAGPGVSDAYVSDWVTVNPATLNPSVALLTSVQATALAGQAYQIVDQTKFNCAAMGDGVFNCRQRFQDFTFPAPSVPNTERIHCRGTTTQFITCRVQLRITFSGGAAVVFNASGIDFPALTDWGSGFSGLIATVGVSAKNVSFELQGPTQLLVINTVMDGGFIESNILSTQPNNSGNLAANAFCGGNLSVQGQCGIFNSPKSAIIIKRGCLAQISSPVYGGGGGRQNTGFGLEVLEGGEVYILSTQTPTITGSSNDLQLEGSGTALPALEPSAGGSLPATSALATWTNWTSAPFSRNVMSYKTGALIASVGNT